MPQQLAPDLGDVGARALRSRAEIETAVDDARRVGLCPSPVLSKHWDNWIALRVIANAQIPREDPIADLGCRGGILLTWLYQQGYRNLWGCDLRFPLPPVKAAAGARMWATVIKGARMFVSQRRRMRLASVEDTGMPTGHFAAVTCMSVIEHGVDVRAFLAECSRLLRPAGILVVSTDYWPTPIDVGNLKRFRQTHDSDRIFDAAALRLIIDDARLHGFDLAGPVDLAVKDAVIASAGHEYTFAVLVFRKGGLRG